MCHLQINNLREVSNKVYCEIEFKCLKTRIPLRFIRATH